jgi:hypothetical protein
MALSAPSPISLTAPQLRRANLFSWFSPKANRFVMVESYLEYRHLLWREIDPTVLALCERPSPRIDAQVKGKRLIYTFDAWIRQAPAREMLIEVKPAAKLDPTEGRPPRWDLVRAWCEPRGLQCDWVTDEQLAPYMQLLNNWEELLPYVSQAHCNPDEEVREEVRELYRSERSLTLSSIPGFLTRRDPDVVVCEVFYLIYQCELAADLRNQAVTRRLVVHSP